jgi:hypothetical protein
MVGTSRSLTAPEQGFYFVDYAIPTIAQTPVEGCIAIQNDIYDNIFTDPEIPYCVIGTADVDSFRNDFCLCTMRRLYGHCFQRRSFLYYRFNLECEQCTQR